MKTRFKVYVPLDNNVGWCVDTFNDLDAAKRCADCENGGAYVIKVTSEIVYRNGKGGKSDASRPIAEALARTIIE